MKGLTITTPAEASRLLPVTRLSVEPLALAVLTSQPFAGVAPTAVPAINSAGQPTLASIVLLNFGDCEVVCRPKVPKDELTETPTCTLEFFIERSLVPNWNDCQCPMTYLGQHLPEIRKQQVIASWAFSPFDSKRTKCKHADAAYWHGFARIPEEHLSSTLQRSGQSGIFIQVRDSDKRLDARFGAVALFGHSLEDVIRLAKSTSDVLGIVRMGRNGPFALRGRREHLSSIRQKAIPQGITLQEGCANADGDVWILRNVTTSTTCKGLTDALKAVGWPAEVQRPVGRNAWLVKSSQEPPATHLCIGESYVAVVAMKKNQQQESIAIAVDQADLSGQHDVDTASVTTRLSDMKCDLEERLTAKLSTMLDGRIQKCDERITHLASSVESVKAEVATTAEQTQKALDEQSATIQSQLTGNNNAIMQQMQSLFTKMQSELQASLAPEASDPKRQRC